MIPKFSHPTVRPYCAAMYSGLGFSSIVFIIHGVAKYGWDLQKRRMSLDWVMIMTTFNIIGAVVYAASIPERWCPYKYDCVGWSHQIFHFIVILAGLAHMVGLLSAFDYV